MSISNWLKKRQERREWAREKIDDALSNSEEVQKQKIISKENITKEAIKHIGEYRKSNVCPFVGSYSDNKLIELSRDPDTLKDEPFGWPKGTVRGILTLWVSASFMLVTMLMIFLLDLPISIIFEMWKIFAGVFGVIVASYFWTRIKMGKGNNPFSPFNFGG